MKIPHFLTILSLSLGIAAAAGAQDIKFTVPGDKPATPPAADTGLIAPTAALAAPTYTPGQIAEEFGWFVAKRSGVADLQFSPAEIDALTKGFTAAISGKPSPFELRVIGPEMDSYFGKKQAVYLQQLKQMNDAASSAFFAKLSSDKDVVTLPSGLRYKIVKPGTGDSPKPSDTVTVNYVGALVDGSVFDSSDKHGGKPVNISLDQVIPGWTEGIQKINRGGKIQLFVPAALGYGDEGRPGIPPGSTLVFDIELVDFGPTPPPPPGGAAPANQP